MSQLNHKIGSLICRIFMRVFRELLMRRLFCCSRVAAHANEAIVGLVNARLNRSWVSGMRLVYRFKQTFQSSKHFFFYVTFHSKTGGSASLLLRVKMTRNLSLKNIPAEWRTSPRVLVSMRRSSGSRSRVCYPCWCASE